MDLMKEINTLAEDYTPAEEPIQETRFTMMQSALRKPDNVEPSDKLDLAKKRKKKKHVKDYMKSKKA